MELSYTMRTVTYDDVQAAARGLRLWSRSCRELRALVTRHESVDLFASRAIAQAAREALEWKRLTEMAEALETEVSA